MGLCCCRLAGQAFPVIPLVSFFRPLFIDDPLNPGKRVFRAPFQSVKPVFMPGHPYNDKDHKGSQRYFYDAHFFLLFLFKTCSILIEHDRFSSAFHLRKSLCRFRKASYSGQFPALWQLYSAVTLRRGQSLHGPCMLSPSFYLLSNFLQFSTLINFVEFVGKR